MAVVNIVDCRAMTVADERAAMCKRNPGDWAWVLALIARVEPQPVHGQRGFFEVSDQGSQVNKSRSPYRGGASDNTELRQRVRLPSRRPP